MMRTACSTPITNRPRMRSIGSLARSIESASSVSIHVHFRGTLNCSILSVDKKRNFSRKRANEDEGDITYINERNRVFNKKASLLPQCHAMSYLIAGFLPDCSILRQIHSGDSRKFRTWHCSMSFVSLARSGGEVLPHYMHPFHVQFGYSCTLASLSFPFSSHVDDIDDSLVGTTNL